jgi:polyhydroxybutyrate depolymerase
MRVGDRERSYLAYVPARLPSGAALVIVLHGSGMDGAKMRAWTGYEFDHMADQQGFVVLYPDGHKHNWNDCRKNATFPAKMQNIDDMGFIRALIDRVKAEHAINPKRVYAFGYSNGGHSDRSPQRGGGDCGPRRGPADPGLFILLSTG